MPDKPDKSKPPERKSVLPKGYTPPPEKSREKRPPAAQPAKPAPTAKPKPEPSAARGRGHIAMRRRPRAFTGFLSGVLYVLAVLGLSFWMGSIGWSWARDVLALQKDEIEETPIVYRQGMTVTELSRILKNMGVIEHEWLFRLYCNVSKAEEKMAPGEYMIAATDYRDIVHRMTPGSDSRVEVTVTFREGLTMEQMFRLLEENKVAPFDALEEAAATVNWKYDYLKNLPAVPNRLEGYLFPDTYTFYVNETPSTALQRFVREFDRRLTSDMRKHAQASGYTLHQLITIASMVEAESGADMEERKNIASVIYNRLENWQTPMLNIDATLLYFMEGRREITAADLNTDHPYNTYIYPGLPPGPICSPSTDSIRAALYPNKTGYYYYLLDDEDVTQFSKTQEEHEQKRASYNRYR